MIRLENVLKTSSEDVLKMSWGLLENVLRTSWRRFEEVLKTSWRRLEDFLKMILQDILKTFWRRLEDVLKTSWRRITKMNILGLIKTSSEDVWVKQIYSSWSRRLEDILKLSSEDEDERRLQEVFKTPSLRGTFAVSGLQLYWKGDSGTDVFQWIWEISKNTFSYRTPLVAASVLGLLIFLKGALSGLRQFLTTKFSFRSQDIYFFVFTVSLIWKIMLISNFMPS